MKTWQSGLLVGAISAGWMSGAMAAAQPAASGDNDNIEEIVVTAQKREEKLQDVPIAITVVSAKQLEDQHVTSMADLARTSPALEMIQSFGGPGGGGQIRGIGTQSFTRSAEGAVGIVVDGVSQGNLNVSNIFDTAQVEVLRGPQGTLFGLTSSAGVINMTTNAPDPGKFASNWHIDYAHNGSLGSEYGQATVHGVVNVPITGDSALRVAGSFDRQVGVQHNNFDDSDSEADNYGLRARYRWTPSDNFSLNIIGDYQRTLQYGSGLGLASFTYVTADPTLTAQLAACGITPGLGNQDRCASHLQQHFDTNYGFSAQMDWAVGSSKLTSITSFRHDKFGPDAQDIQALPGPNPQLFSYGGLGASRQYSEELRLASAGGTPWDYTVGAFYSNAQSLTYNEPDAFFHIQLAVPFPPFTLDVGTPTTTYTQTLTRSEAVFGHLEYHVNDQFTLISGARYTREQLSDYDSPAGAKPGETDPLADTLGVNKVNVSGVLGAQFKFTPQWTSYATVTKGFKGPQVQSATPTTPRESIPAEIPTSIELGIKGSVLDGRFGTDLSVFNTKVKDYQGQTCTLNGQGILVCLPNSFDVTTRGVELDFYGKLFTNFSINGGFIYNQAKYPSDYNGLDPNNLSGGVLSMGGLQLVGVAREKFTLSGNYTIPLNAVNLEIGADSVYKSDVRMGYSADSRFVMPSGWNFGLRLGVRSIDGKWGVTAFGRDLNNRHEPVVLFGGPAFYGPSPAVGGIPFFFNPAYPNGAIAGVSGWVSSQSLREVGLSVDFKF